MVEPDPQFEQHLHFAEERFRLLVESVRDYAIFMLDVKGYVVSWNTGAERLKGYSAAEILGCHFSRFYLPEDIAARKPEIEIERATADGRVEDEGWRVRKDGTRFWANVVLSAVRDDYGTLMGFAKVTRDLTERKRAEEQLRTSEALFRQLVSGVEEYAIFMLDAGGRVATWNLGGERIKGYKAEEILGESYERFFRPEDRAKGLPARLLAEARLHGHVRTQGPRMRKDGSTFYVDAVITALYDSSGKFLGYSKVTRDISDQIRNKELEDAKLAAEKANAAKDEFLAVLSHELRTPLTPVLAAAGYLEESLSKLPPEMHEEVRMIRRNVQLQSQLIDDLLDLTRITRGKLELHAEPVDLHTVLSDVVGICRETIVAKELEVSFSLKARDHWVSADPVRIRQVFWNVVTNAVKFSPPAGKIEIRSENDDSQGVRVEIQDSGMGISPDQTEKIFEAFEQGGGMGRRFGGLGLGLAITRKLVRLHRGTITASSEGLGHGATFTVTLGCSVPVPAESKPPVDAPINGRRTLRILLVEDHEDTRRILEKLLRRQNHEVTTATNAQSAMSQLDSAKFDVLVSDIGLGGDSGYRVMREARKRQSLKGIALSGFGMEEDVHRSKAAGFDFHLTKPVDFKDLDAALKELFQD